MADEDTVRPKRHWFARVEWKPQDCWFGIFWRREGDTEFNLWVCLIPMLPLHVGWTTWVDPPSTGECPDDTTWSVQDECWRALQDAHAALDRQEAQ